MIFMNEFQKYDQIIFYGCIKKDIEQYVEYLNIDKCYIADTNYKLWGNTYKGIRIDSIDKLSDNSQNKALIILPRKAETDIYYFVRKKGFLGDVYFKDMVGIKKPDYKNSELTGMYTVERHTQLLIAALKEYEIHNIVVSPGGCNMNFVYSIQNDTFFNLYSCVDEISAAYMACGISQATGKPTALSCTGATASRNYMSALTEAYYSKLPILVISSSRDSFMIRNGIDQITDRLHIPTDIVGYATEISFTTTENEYEYCQLNIKKALSHLYLQGGRPVHINLITRFEKDFSFKTLPEFQKLNLFSVGDDLPMIPADTVLHILPGCDMNEQSIHLLECFAEQYNVLIVGDHLSNYKGKHFINISLLADQNKNVNVNVNTLITVGEISKSSHIKAKKTWRIAEDNSIYDRDLNIEAYFDMSLNYFLKWYLKQKCKQNLGLAIKTLKELDAHINDSIKELPFSNAWFANEFLKNIPENTRLYLGIYSTLKIWNYFNVPLTVKCYSTVGGFGIDGIISAMIGSSLINNEQLHFAIVGDLSFFYDLNILGNNNVGKNVRIIVMNNNGGHSLKNNNGLPNTDMMPKYISAPNHFIGNGSVIKSYVESLGFCYALVENKKEALEQMSILFDYKGPVIMEVRYESGNDTEAVRILSNLI